MKIFFEKALVLAPHTDDGELACGATISNLLRQGTEVYYVAFSSCSDVYDTSQGDVLRAEMYAATAVLGIKRENVNVFDFPVRKFKEHRQAILDLMVKLNLDLQPEVVFAPSIHDIHQDHITIAYECLRAFKKRTILQYEVPWNNYTFDNQFYYCVDDSDVELKIKAIQCYRSQKHRDYTQQEFIKGLLLTHGVQIGEKYAEVYEIPHLVCRGQGR